MMILLGGRVVVRTEEGSGYPARIEEGRISGDAVLITKKGKSKIINQSERLALTVSSRSNKDRFAFIM
jgi:hypothetical protein